MVVALALSDGLNNRSKHKRLVTALLQQHEHALQKTPLMRYQCPSPELAGSLCLIPLHLDIITRSD